MSPEMLDLMKTRRSVKPMLMHGAAPSAAEIETILTIAARTPDHGKLAPWRFIVFEGEAGVRASALIASVFRADNPAADEDTIAFEAKRLSRAPLVIGVVSQAEAHGKIPEWEQVLSVGAVCMNLTIAANALGYGTNWLTEWYAYDRRVLDGLGLQPHERMAGFIHIGRSDAPSQERERPVLADIITRF